MKLLKILFSFLIIIVFLNISAQTDFQEKIKQNEKKLGEIKKQLNIVKSKKYVYKIYGGMKWDTI